jgi:hypothetical protein
MMILSTSHFRLAVILLLAIAFALVSSGCGGGGGGGGATSTITGQVLQVETGGAPNPQVSVQAGSGSVLSSAVDGSFTLSVPAGSTTVTVDTRSSAGVWTFTIPATTANQNEDVGELWVGASQVTISGKVVDSTTSNPVQGAKVSFAGRVASTAADGSFNITQVAYPASNFAAFDGIVGSASATNYISNSFNAGSATVTGGVLTIANVLLTPQSSNTPPSTPYTIHGTITPSSIAAGTTVTLSLNGTVVRITHADVNGNYQFWVGPGTYSLSFVNGAHSAPNASVIVKSQTDVEQVNATLQ